MHTDPNKKYDKRNIESNIRSSIMTKKDYETYLSKLPDVSEKLFIPEESPESLEGDARKDDEIQVKKRKAKKKVKGKGKS